MSSTPFWGLKVPHTRWLPRMLTWQCRSPLRDKKILISPVAPFWPATLSWPEPGDWKLPWNPILVISSRCFSAPSQDWEVVRKKITIGHLVDVKCLEGVFAVQYHLAVSNTRLKERLADRLNRRGTMANVDSIHPNHLPSCNVFSAFLQQKYMHSILVAKHL